MRIFHKLMTPSVPSVSRRSYCKIHRSSIEFASKYIDWLHARKYGSLSLDLYQGAPTPFAFNKLRSTQRTIDDAIICPLQPPFNPPSSCSLAQRTRLKTRYEQKVPFHFQQAFCIRQAILTCYNFIIKFDEHTSTRDDERDELQNLFIVWRISLGYVNAACLNRQYFYTIIMKIYCSKYCINRQS